MRCKKKFLPGSQLTQGDYETIKKILKHFDYMSATLGSRLRKGKTFRQGIIYLVTFSTTYQGDLFISNRKV